MRTFLKASLVWSGILLSFACYSQTIPLGALPMQYNPAFAGRPAARGSVQISDC